MEPWKIDDKFKKILTEPQAKLILDEAEKAFNDTIETSFKILERNTSLLQLVAGILVGLVAYVIGKLEPKFVLENASITAIAGIFYFFSLGLFFIFPNVKPKVYVLPGAQPKNLFVDAIFSTPNESRVLHIYMIKIKALQEGIAENRKINDHRWDYYKRSLNFLFYSPLVMFAIYSIITLLQKL